MKETAKQSSWLDLGRGDRILLGIFAPMVTALLIVCVVALYFWSPNEVWSKIVRLLLQEAAAMSAALSVLVAIWAIARPRWAAELLEKRLLRTLAWVVGVSAALTTLLILAFILG